MDRIYFGIRMPLAIGEAVSEQSNPLTHENSNQVWMSPRVRLFKIKAAGFGTLQLLLMLPEAPCRLSPREPRDQSYADLPCLRNRHAHERRV
jgi:hypothetical protein